MPALVSQLINLFAAVLLLLGWFVSGWYGSGPLGKATPFTVPDGSSLSSVAAKLEADGEPKARLTVFSLMVLKLATKS